MEPSDFISLGISRELQEQLLTMEITVPTDVQIETIPAVLAGSNLVVQSPTGSGKTLAYLLPLLNKMDIESKDMEFLVLTPSRELAAQVVKVVRAISAERFKTVSFIGGASQIRQLDILKEKPKLAVGTPGRVLELLKKRKINAQAIRAIVIDEADKMFSAGFMNDVRAILKATLKSRQVLFYSATIPRELREDAPEIMGNAEFILIGEKSRIPETIEHHYILCDKTKRNQLLEKLLRFYKPHKSIVFIQRNEGVGPLAGRLQEQGFSAAGLHSDLSQQHRRDVLQKFREGATSILITTDLLARGIDIEDVDFIFNYDLPLDEEFYLHRVGRTGRAGKPGTAVTLLEEKQKFVIGKFSRYLKIEFNQIGLDKQDQVFIVEYNKAKK
ncbi:MAG: ATP-dependent helicase [Firmicutes bacterium HGW-Firmicutes-12]|jgi:superfamily II DNA/RNA helicase|nr:MAG: ATP-dependent helicase [Firmicutes bacterium HGW-Firmicutes-12]